MPDNFDAIVDFSMNEEGQKEVVNGAKSVEQALREMENAAKNAGKTVKQTMDENAAHLKTYSTTATTEGKKVEKSYDEQAKAAAKAASAQAAIWNQEARQLTTRARILQTQSREMMKVADAVGILGRSLLIGGGAITGGIFKLANDFVKNAPNATRLTLQWKAAQDSLAESQSRVGKVSAEIALPILQKVAQLAERAAGFVEKNPELVRSALNVGIVTAGLGAIGILVSKGIKLQADLLYIQSVPLMLDAAHIQLAASEQALIAAQLNAEAANIEVASAGEAGLVKAGSTAGAGATGVGGLLGSIAVPLAAFAAGLIATDKVFDAIQGHDVTFKDYVTTFKQSLAIDAKKFGDWLSGLGIKTGGGQARMLFQADTGNQMFDKVAKALGLLKNAADDTADSLDALAGSVEGSPKKDELLKAYEKYTADDLELVREHYAKRRDIVQDGLADEAAANRQYTSQVGKVNSGVGASLSKLQQDYNKQYLKDEANYLKQRQDILEGAGEDVQRIEQDLQEKLRKNFLEHQFAGEDLIAARDALGLAKENRRFEAQQSEERRQANLEIKRLRADLAKRLTELDQEYAAERAQRYQEFLDRQAEIRKQASDRLIELAKEHAEEINKIRAQTAAKLREEDAQFIAERKRRYDYFIAQIRDLDASLLGQRNLNIQYQNLMLKDLDAFLARYRAGLQSITNSTVSQKAEGGYTAGLVNTGEHGYEWIATHASTTAAENIIGGKLTQEKFMQALMALKASNQATYVDNRRMEGFQTKENKQAYIEGAKQALKEVLGI